MVVKHLWRIAAVGLVGLTVTALSTVSSGAAGGNIVLGASIPVTGPLSVFGPLMKEGYEQAVADINAQGGLSVSGQKHKVSLDILDDQSDPTATTQQLRTLVQQDHAVGLLGPTTPPLTIPASATAEVLHVPLVSGLTPIRAWLGGSKSGWKWSWDFFIDELKFTQIQFKVANTISTNKKVALFTDTEQDGQVMGGLWTQNAPKLGYKIAYHATFPVGTTDFTSFINKAKASGAQIVITQMIPPDGVTLWKQMKSLNYVPRLAFCEKCGNNGGWGKALGQIAVGTSTLGYWSSSLGYPRTKEFVTKFAKQTGNNEDLSTIVEAYTVADIMLEAIQRAGSTDAAKINAALAKTNGLFPAGHIGFGANHASAIFLMEKQWASPTTEKVIYPLNKAQAKLITPVIGLR